MFKSEITPLLIGHISGGAIAVLAGATALAARKGSPVHRAAGTIFVMAMLVGASSAAWLGYTADPQDMGDVVAGAITVYMVSTAYAAAKRADNKVGLFEGVACAVAALGGAAGFLGTAQQVAAGTALFNGIPGYIFASVASLAALLDLSVILRRGVAGRQRIARHLWRMMLGFFVAVGSFFPGQLHLFPKAVREVEPVIILFVPAFSLIAIMLFWLVRVQMTRWWSET
jgi:hypothetical protein